ncbi:hypothetical protein J2X63_003199 [Agromyces sp. 3263]|uniref:DUF7341 domain-containing protein n=1 Tax=Agromyces sp. 3263 TaxID=2817750 RepID=UPI0028578D1D|nr:hypothetical protein [Agromyces sp. 3263]MDR6907491.1 hypothetical protein [Agromyces sp. 3263]
MTDLSDAVNALTKPSRTKVIRDDNTTVTVHHDPLLAQLEQAVTSAIGNGGGGGSATGSVLNDEALYRLTVIRTQLGDWCRLVNVKHDRQDAVQSLRRWHVAFLGGTGEADFYVKALRGWAYTIVELLDPPKTVPLAGACPVCKAVNWVGPDDTLRASPVAVMYDHANPYRSVRAMCRVETCDAEWVGADSVEELVEEMSEADHG